MPIPGAVDELKSEPRLFCKPQVYDGQNQVLFTKNISKAGSTISFRSLNLSQDLDMIHDWVNQAYSKRFWQLNGSLALVEMTYRAILQNAGTHSFIGLLDGRPMCQIDAYLLAVDELKKEVLDWRPNDCGFHLLMIPPQKSEKGLSRIILRTFFEFYFSFKESDRLFGEPDRENTLANRLAISTGMEFLYKVQLSYKEANLYAITKQQFHETIPND
jgi:RimJ/RimL family protein N-acetyltransferase